MAHVLAVHHVDDVLADVLGVIADALERAHHPHDVQTAADRTRLNQQQNALSNKIYADKHNANNAHYGNNEVGQRRLAQQKRIANGIRSGKMTPGEATRTEGKEQHLNRQIAGMRQANGGKLTPGEHQKVNQEQNKLSKQIYAQKHNGKTGF